MSFDPMAAAIDWLDAYRAGDIEGSLRMYADDAVVRCGCGGTKTITGKERLRAYWLERLREYPAFDLDNLQPTNVGTLISYVSRDGIVKAVLTFNASGLVARRRIIQNEARDDLHAKPRALDNLGGKPSFGTRRSTVLHNVCPAPFKFRRSVGQHRLCA
jgi:hypothetical protein